MMDGERRILGQQGDLLHQRGVWEGFVCMNVGSVAWSYIP